MALFQASPDTPRFGVLSKKFLTRRRSESLFNDRVQLVTIVARAPDEPKLLVEQI